MSDPPIGASCRFALAGAIHVGMVTADGIALTGFRSALDAIVDGLPRDALDGLRRRIVDPEDPAITWLAPVEPRTMLYAGRNYEDHLAENPRPRQAEPTYFSKLVSSLIGHNEPVRIGPDQHVDYEGELAVIIGRPAHRVALDQALEVVAGFTIANDVSDRAVQHVNHQVTMGKGPDTFGPLGPYLVPRALVGDGSGLRLRTWVNGSIRQDGNTSDLIHGVAACIVAATRTVTLQPGDVIATGTPAGTGAYMDPPTFLRPGDNVAVAIDGLGRLENPVAAWSD